MRRCLVCLLLDDPEKVQRAVHQTQGRAEEGFLPHRFDPGERRVRDLGRQKRRDQRDPRKERIEVTGD